LVHIASSCGPDGREGTRGSKFIDTMNLRSPRIGRVSKSIVVAVCHALRHYLSTSFPGNGSRRMTSRSTCWEGGGEQPRSRSVGSACRGRTQGPRGRSVRDGRSSAGRVRAPHDRSQIAGSSDRHGPCRFTSGVEGRGRQQPVHEVAAQKVLTATHARPGW
jgi:hypothetical protein